MKKTSKKQPLHKRLEYVAKNIRKWIDDNTVDSRIMSKATTKNHIHFHRPAARRSGQPSSHAKARLLKRTKLARRGRPQEG